MNITVSELIMSVYGVPVDFVAAFQLGWKLGKEFCLVTGFILTLLGMYSINIFTSIAIYRLIVVHENVSISNSISIYSFRHKSGRQLQCNILYRYYIRIRTE